MFFLLLACGTPSEPVAFCDAALKMYYDPRPDGNLSVFPDDFWTVPDNTPTGRRIALHSDEVPMLSSLPENFVGIYDDLSTLDGFGLTSGLWLTAEDVLPEIDPSQVRLRAGEQDWPVDLSVTDFGRTLMVLPRYPLPEASEASLVLLTDPQDPQCVAPSEYTRKMLDPSLGDEGEQARRWRAALQEMAVDPSEVAGMTVFTTQSATTVGRAVAEDVANRSYALAAPMTCQPVNSWRQCDGALTVMDYRDADHIVPPDSDGTPLGSYDLPVRVWLPTVGTGPYPVVMCGHGLGGDKGDCQELADIAEGESLAVVAVDAVEHGEHPGRTDPGMDLIKDFMIFAINISPPGLNARRLRDNFRQSAWDKLQVIRAIQEGMDVDGDGTVDLDGQRLSYVGVSLGAIMGPEPMALSSAFQGGALVVGGGRISSIIQDSPSFSVLVDVMRPAEVSDGDVDRFFPVLQTVIDAGDPMVYGPHVISERFADTTEPDVLALLAWQDQVVPNSSNEAFVRGLEIPGVGTEIWPVEGLEWKEAPMSGNLPQGGTGGMLQLGEVQMEEGGAWEPADHSYTHSSVQGRKAILAFMRALLAGTVPVIEEPTRP